jgi:hypothetical protein
VIGVSEGVIGVMEDVIGVTEEPIGETKDVTHFQNLEDKSENDTRTVWSN